MKLQHKAEQWQSRLLQLYSERSIHWRAPTIMIFSLCSGILISFVHHIFNTLMDGHGAGGSTEQQWVRRVETAFAFASKMFLAISTTVAYNQYLWYHVNHHASRMASLDAMFSAVNSSFRFIHVRLWRGRPVLAIIALVIWYDALPVLLQRVTDSVEDTSTSSHIHSWYTDGPV
jgi:hypothetical protein